METSPTSQLSSRRRRAVTVKEVESLARKSGRHSIGDGLLLNVSDGGSCSWTCRIRMPNGKRRDIGLGAYPEVTLAEARERAAEMRRQVRDGLDPLEEKRRARQKALTFAEAAEKCWQERLPGFKNGKHREQWITSLRTYAFPTIGSTPIAELRHPEVKALLQPIWHTKKETARRILQRVAEVVVWSIGEGLREHELPKSVIRKALGDQRMKVQHFDAVAVEDAPVVYEKLKALGSYAAEALRFQILTALRPGAARRARWEQVDLDLGLWTIPAAEMKSDEEHVVPLSKEALELLKALPRLEGSPFLFPGSQPAKKALSDTGVRNVLKELAPGATMHGWRSTFRDWAAENTNFPEPVIEAALAHTLDDETRAAYRRTKFLDARAELMQTWANYLEGRIAIVSRLDAAHRKRKAVKAA